MLIKQSRRRFSDHPVRGWRRGVLGTRSSSLADEGPPEVTTLRLGSDPNMCVAPQYIAEDLLRADGFTDIRYLPSPRSDARER